jgi:hypothetical protein
MGTYLSTPVLDKHTEKGADLDSSTPCRWAVVDMQGWRKSMEDAHVARTDVPLPSSCCSSGAGNDGGGGGGAAVNINKAKVFAVFDGHGGAEVARFCQMNLVPVLTSQDAWKNMCIAADKKPSAGTAADSDEAAMQEVEAKAVGQALIDAFHALDRLIDDPNSREDIDRWRTERPPPYVSGEQEEEQSQSTKENGDDKLQPVTDEENVQQRRHTVMDPNEIAGSVANLQQVLTDDDTDGGVEASNNDPSDTDSDNLENEEADGVIHDDSDDDEKVEVNNTNENDDGEIADDDGKKEKGTVTLSTSDAVTLFQKLLHLNVTDDDDSDEDDEEGDSDSAKLNGYSTPGDGEPGSEVEFPTKEQLLNPPTGIVAPSASVPTKIQNGRKVRLCLVTLPRQHGIHLDFFLTFFFLRHCRTILRSVTFLTILYTQDAHPLSLL